MGRRSFKGDKRRRELVKKKKQEAKRQRRQNKDGEESGEPDNAYLEYLNPGGPMDEKYLPEEEDEENGEDKNENS